MVVGGVVGYGGVVLFGILEVVFGVDDGVVGLVVFFEFFFDE